MENGAKAILIEKNALSAGIREDIGAIGSKLQIKEGIEIDKVEIVNALARYASYQVEQRLIKFWADESGETVDWYTDLFNS